MSIQVRRFMAIEIIVNNQGQTNIPDQTQLRGCVIDSVTVLSPIVCAVSPVTNSTNVATETDLKNMTISLLRASDNVLQNIPMLMLNPFTNYNGSAASQMMRELFLPQYIDWNQSFIKLGAAPSSTPIVISLGVYYYNPSLPIKTA